MKTIFKKPLWFTVTTTLCLVVATLLAVSGCDKLEISSKPVEQGGGESEIPPKQYTVSFVGEGVSIEPQTVVHGDFAIEPAEPTREDHIFKGWYKTDNPSFIDQWNYKADIVTQDTILYAQWKELIVPESNLLGTQWKLVGIGSLGEVDLQELEPKYCGNCYTLFFDTHWFLRGQTGNNSFFSEYENDYSTGSFRLTHIQTTEVGDIGDGYLYSKILFFKVQSFIYKDTYPRTLHLYYNDGENYLKYKEIGD